MSRQLTKAPVMHFFYGGALLSKDLHHALQFTLIAGDTQR